MKSKVKTGILAMHISKDSYSQYKCTVTMKDTKQLKCRQKMG